mmetsp:Transcript_16743/g.38657  ORF Transcript_16743/g.38657 Transcript_16743/m.38657 type:complete len:138 (-) Transcript_16743:1427-1840(-)
MSLLHKWGSKSLLRLCMPNTSSTNAGFRNVSILSSSKSLSTRSPSCIIKPPTSFAMSLSSHYVWMPLRFKSGVKTNSGCKKRFRVRGSGSIKRGKAGKSHNTGYLKRQRANRLGHSTGIEGKKIEQRVRKLLGVFNG